MLDHPRTEEESVDFGGLDITFDSRILRPRAWTTRQSRWAEEILVEAPAGDVLEICSGAGHIGLLAVASSTRRLVMVDVDPVACSFAQRNAAAAGMADRVEVRTAPIDVALSPAERFALVIADPPWVESSGTTAFPQDPLLAIDGGDDGLDIARRCVAAAAAHLVQGGSLLMQLGSSTQAEAVSAHSPFETASLLTEPGRGIVVQMVRSNR